MSPGYNNATLEYVTSPPDEGVIIGVAIPLGLLFLVVLVVLGSVIEVRVRLLLLSVPVLRARVVPLLDARPPQFLVWCCVERRGAPGCWELLLLWGAGVDGVGVRSAAAGAYSVIPAYSPCCAPHCRVALVLTFLLLAPRRRCKVLLLLSRSSHRSSRLRGASSSS